MYLNNEESLKLQEELYLISKQLKANQINKDLNYLFLKKVLSQIVKNIKRHSILLKELA